MRTPRQAAFFWTGHGSVPWIRTQAPLTFAAQHPGWRVFLYTDCDAGDLPGVEVRELKRPVLIDKELWNAAHAAGKSDMWRYWWLAQEGGLYADTDIVFYGSLEPLVEGLDAAGHECAITQDCGYKPGGRGALALSIGVLTSQQGSKFFTRIASQFSEPRPIEFKDYQTAGVVPIFNIWEDLCQGASVGNIPGRLVYGKFSMGSRWSEREAAMKSAWDAGVSLSRGAVALHWFGGSRFSVNADKLTPETFLEHSEAPIGKALALALASSESV